MLCQMTNKIQEQADNGKSLIDKQKVSNQQKSKSRECNICFGFMTNLIGRHVYQDDWICASGCQDLSDEPDL
jgi:hypothetical protein